MFLFSDADKEQLFHYTHIDGVFPLIYTYIKSKKIDVILQWRTISISIKLLLFIFYCVFRLFLFTNQKLGTSCGTDKQQGLEGQCSSAYLGAVHKWRNQFFDIFDPNPPLPLVTHFTKQAYGVMSSFGRSPPPFWVGEVIYGQP